MKSHLSLTDSRQSAKHRRAILSGALLSEEHPPSAIQLKLFYQISQIEDHYCSMHIAQYFSVILMIRSLLSSKKLKDHLVGWQPTTVAESTDVELIEATFPLVNWAEGRDKT